MDKRKFLLISAIAALIPAAGRAQAPAISAEQSTGTGLAVVRTRIVEECNTNTGCTAIPQPQMKTIRLPIPGYKPEDADQYFYRQHQR